MRRPQHDRFGRGKEETMTGIDPQDATTTAYTDHERAIVTALSRLRPQGPDADSAARVKDRLMLLLTAESAASGAPAPSAAIAS